MFRLCVIVAAASVQLLLTSATHSVKRSSDPVADMCFPPCENETIMEMECAHKLECFEVDEEESEKFTDCLAPCWDIASACFTLCSESLSDVINKCANICANFENETCASTCFQIAFTKLKNDVLYHSQNATSVDYSTNSEPTSTGNTPDDLTEEELSTPSLALPSLAASSPFLRLSQNKTLRSDKSNSIRVLHEDADSGNDTQPPPENPESQYEKFGDTAAYNSNEFLQADNNVSKPSLLSRWRPNKEALQSLLLNYDELLETYLKIRYSLNRNASERITNRRMGIFAIHRERSSPERKDKRVKEFSNESTVPLNKVPYYESESKIDRLLQANRQFLQRDGVDMDTVDKALNKFLELLQGSPETGSELIG